MGKCKNITCGRERLAGETWEMENYCSDECFHEAENTIADVSSMHDRIIGAMAYLSTLSAELRSRLNNESYMSSATVEGQLRAFAGHCDHVAGMLESKPVENGEVDHV
jgi:hypothetical protein